ncbi:LexA family transcriptional regulator [Methylosinus sp. Sm6]|uniref:XRE family transcriptional regulator n=1 Tax=Methylosinus sp. Sm6 TaxID=2866948 RepID=UPI001C991EDA|nr:helix-turn-helix domain-containing protein [Methylosinus sp. Sm6]
MNTLLAPYGSIAKASKALGIPASTLSRLRRGINEPTSESLLSLAKALNVSMEYLVGLSDEPIPSSPSLSGQAGDVSAFTRVPRLDVRAAAGGGAVNHATSVETYLAFPRWMLERLAPSGSKLTFLRALGDSMEPTIIDGALMLVIENVGDMRLPQRAPKRRHVWEAVDIYVFLLDGETRVKRLRNAAQGAVLIISDNPAYDLEVLLKEDLNRLAICGRVIWWDNRL